MNVVLRVFYQVFNYYSFYDNINLGNKEITLQGVFKLLNNN